MDPTSIMPTYKRLEVCFERGEGVWLYDTEGRRYLDALAGIAVCGLGHAQLTSVQPFDHTLNGQHHLLITQHAAVVPRFFDQFMHGTKMSALPDLRILCRASSPSITG